MTPIRNVSGFIVFYCIDSHSRAWSKSVMM